VFAEPTEIADRYHKALELYLAELKQIVLGAAVDYHRVSLGEDYEVVLRNFLAARTRTKGVR
jgi:hypothetical protein